MAQRETARVKVTNKLGLHARPAMTFVDMASEFSSDIKVTREGEDPVDGKSIMQMLMLAATQGTELDITAEGEDAKQAITQLTELVKSKFNEE